MTTTTFQFDLNPACSVYLQTIDAAQRHGESEESMEQLRETTLSRLDQQWAILEQLAFHGLESSLSALLDVFLREWAIKEALDVLLRYPGQGIDIDDQELQAAFQQKLARQQQVLASELLLYLEKGKQARKEVQAQQQPTHWETFALQVMQGHQQHQRDWQDAAFRLGQQQHQQQQDWQDAAFQLLQEQRASWQAHHQVALSGVHQAQQSVEQIYHLAATVQSNVVGMLQATQDQHYLAVEEAARQVTMRKWRNKLLTVGLLLLAVPVLLGLCFFLLTHLY